MNPAAAADHTSPLTLGACATLACLWEVTATKPGNVYRGADFEDLNFADFVTGAAIVGPIVDRTAACGVGASVLAGVAATRAAVATNVNLGILLLLTPLAAVPAADSLADGVGRVLDRMTADDTAQIYAAIRLARPGGLGRVDQADVHDEAPPALRPREVMAPAADRDLVARQYVNDFREVFRTADRIVAGLGAGLPLSEAIIRGYLMLLAEEPDSLIARKCGLAVAAAASARAGAVLAALEQGADAYRAAVREFDFWLRSDGHRRNPGTSADITAAAIFSALREQKLPWPVEFYQSRAD